METTKWQYTNGVRNLEAISPDTWNMDQLFLDRPGNDEIQLALLYSYGTNPPLYPQWQEYFRKYQPPTLIVWGKNDHIFPAEGAYPYKRGRIIILVNCSIGRPIPTVIYSYFQVNRPRGRGTALLISVNLM
ncbi:alpha/beta fold hydrolase [Nostoc sp.]|uniref:alpha/beta fold hydrolase n=1 Tax=Nostoc sp. TaxID=1180 RepID=UPI002FF5034D